MEDIVKTEEGQRFFDFLDIHWGAVILSPNCARDWQSIRETITRLVDTEDEYFDSDLFESNEYNNIIQYFLTMGSSY